MKMALLSFPAKAILAIALLAWAMDSSSQFVAGCYTSIFAFGDSITDTGNYAALCKNGFLQCDRFPTGSVPPYGETFFHRPTGRCSDGRLIIDFIAEHYGLPLLPTYAGDKKENFAKGVNFAVVGATSLEEDNLDRENVSLTYQINRFKGLLPSICKTSSCEEIFGRSLVVFGPFGGNDYVKPMLNKTIEETYRLQALIINAIASGIEELIELGVVNLMVPGTMADGCTPLALAAYYGSNEEDFDQATGCLTWLNKFAQNHNKLLKKELTRIQESYPNVFITYADYYNASLQHFLSPENYGFSNETRLSACCGGGGPYNMDDNVKCGNPSSHVCDDPSSYIAWDGGHKTEAAYRWMAKGLLSGLYTSPNITKSCTPANGNGVYGY